MSDFRMPTHTFEDGAYNPTQVRLYGRPSFEAGDLAGTLEALGVNIAFSEERKETETSFTGLLIKAQQLNDVFLINLSDNMQRMSSGIVFGYAFEGHCYDLPKPKLMLIPGIPEELKCDDCGYEKKADCGYVVWVVDKLDRCVEIEISQGFIEQLVLEANMPGKRSPTTYRATMQVAHRSGRLTE